MVSREVRGRLQQQRGLADARLAADEHQRARNDAAAEHAIELVDAGGRVAGETTVSMSSYNRGPAAAASAYRAPALAAAAPAPAPTGTGRSSTSEFHAPHSGQRPSHFCDCAPHS